MSIMGEMHIVMLLNTIEEINHRADLWLKWFYPWCFNQDNPITHVLNCGMIFIPFSMTNINIQVEDSEFFVHMNKNMQNW